MFNIKTAPETLCGEAVKRLEATLEVVEKFEHHPTLGHVEIHLRTALDYLKDHCAALES